MRGRVLIIAGSDSGGGAGLQADLKTVAALGGFGMTAVTALTAQNTLGVQGVFPVPIAFLEQQLASVLSDLGADAIKTGMLHSVEVVTAVALAIRGLGSNVKVVVDPVMVAKGGASLLAAEAQASVLRELCPLASVITPNAPEAEALTGLAVRNHEDQLRAGAALCRMGAQHALIKGGHLEGATVTDVLVSADGTNHTWSSPRLKTSSTHGTGCTLASAIATLLAQGESVQEAVRLARVYVLEAIAQAPGLGQGHGPLNHGWLSSPATIRETLERKASPRSD